MIDEITIKIPEKRKKILWISAEMFEELLRQIVDFPKDWKFENIYYSFEKNCVGIVIKNDVFDKVKEGCILPDLKCNFIRNINKKDEKIKLEFIEDK